MDTPVIKITKEMIESAKRKEKKVEVNRDKNSKVDTIVGILGEYVFAQYFYGDWQNNNVGKNKGKSDFKNIEVKTSAFPYNKNLNLIVREEYAKKRQPPFYIQIIIDIKSKNVSEIEAKTNCYICGYAKHNEVINAPLKDFGAKDGSSGGYRSYYIPIKNLHPMKEFKKMYNKYQINNRH